MIVRDLHMPEVNGPEFLRQYRATSGGGCMPVVLMSGERGAHIEQLGVRVVLPKPFDLDDLMSAVHAALE